MPDINNDGLDTIVASNGTSHLHMNRRDALKTVLSYIAVPASVADMPPLTSILDLTSTSSSRELPHAYPQTWSNEDVRYIWNETPESGDPLFLRKIVSIDLQPTRAILSILNDAKFGLWVNGSLIRPLKQSASWRLASTYDITRLLRSGKNVLCIQSMALNTDYHSQPLTPLCGVAAQLEFFSGNQSHTIQTDESWSISKQVSDDEWLKIEMQKEDGWKKATIVRAANQAPWVNLKNWPRPLPDPASSSLRILSVKPTKIQLLPDTQAGAIKITVSTVEFEVNRNKTATWYASAAMPLKDRLAFARRELPGITVDFGRQMAGRLRIRSGSDEPMTVLVSLGESPGEMWNGPHTGIHDVFLIPHGSAITITSGFRYATVYAIPLSSEGPEQTKLLLADISCDLVHEPLQYRGSCTASDKMIERLWHTGAYTTHLCLQRELWDAPKRDRNAYGGDLHPVTPILHEVFGNPEPVYRTLDILSSSIWSPGKPLLRHINGINGYSAAWIHVLTDIFLRTGDQAEVIRRLPFLLELLQYMEKDLNEQSLFVNKSRQWCFVDWSAGFDGSNSRKTWQASDIVPECIIATHFFFMSAFRRAAELLSNLTGYNNATLSNRYKELSIKMRDAARQYWWSEHTKSFGNRTQTNAMAIYAGAIEGAEAKHIADTILLAPLQQITHELDWKTDLQVVSPYYYFYVLEATAMAGRIPEAEQAMKLYYGEMLRRGATTFWERFDPRIKPGPVIPGFGFDWLAGMNRDSSLYSESLCHGWSSAPTSWITRHMVGLSPVTAGYSRINITPHLCGLTWIEGSVPTPHGTIRARHAKLTHRWRTELKLPPKTEARLFAPGFEREGAHVFINGKIASLQKDKEGKVFVKIEKEGLTVIETS